MRSLLRVRRATFACVDPVALPSSVLVCCRVKLNLSVVKGYLSVHLSVCKGNLSVLRVKPFLTAVEALS